MTVRFRNNSIAFLKHVCFSVLMAHIKLRISKVSRYLIENSHFSECRALSLVATINIESSDSLKRDGEQTKFYRKI